MWIRPSALEACDEQNRNATLRFLIFNRGSNKGGSQQVRCVFNMDWINRKPYNPVISKDKHVSYD